MKRTFNYFLTGLAMTALLFSCNPKEEPVTPDDGGGNTEEPTPGPGPEETTSEVTFSATAESLAEWEKGDKISIFDGTSIVTGENSENSGATAKFKVTVAKGAKNYSAFFPVVTDLSADRAASTLAVEQPAEGMRAPMMAKGASSRLFFRNLTATVSVVLDMDDAATVKFAAGGAKIAGDFVVDYSGDDPVVASASSDYVSVAASFKRGTVVTMTVLPAEIKGYSLQVYDAAGEVVGFLESEETLNIAPAAQIELGTVNSLKELPTVYQVSHVWLYGGTGPEYNCSRVYDLFNLAEEKQYVFAGPEGHGIDALRDDYIEIYANGTVKVYAGEDKAHWWMAVSKNLDPKKFKELGIADKIGFLPRTEGSVEFGADGALTFTLDDGSTTKNATIVAPGEVVFYEGKYSATLESIGIRYDNSNRKDNWDSPAADYDVFYCNPKSIVYELVQMPEGFVVPAASRTIDDSVYEEPEYPEESDYDYNQLPGAYTLNEFWVLGGSGDDPAFVGVDQKNWCFNGYKAFKDDQLEISVTSMSATTASGTITYSPGADGAYWDYMWTWADKYPVTDLSSFFDRLPKGTNSFSCDLTTGEITFAGDVKATLVIPGIKHYTQGNRDFDKIKDGMVGIEFDIMDLQPASEYRWNDPDRFCVAPILYVMTFTKNQ